MKIFKGIVNWATDNITLYEKENNVYIQILKEIDRIDQNLDFILQDLELLEELEIDPVLKKNYKEAQILIEYNKKIAIINRKQVLEELRKIDENLKKIRTQIKDAVLLENSIEEIQKGIIQINVLIYQNSLLKAFRNLDVQNILKYKWTQNDFDELKKEIAERKSKIIPYLVEIEQMKRK